MVFIRHTKRFLALAVLAAILPVLWPSQAYAQSVGDVIENFATPLFTFDAVFSTIAYMAGLYLAVSAMFKLKDHVDHPDRTPLSDFVKRFIAGGAFLTAPYMAQVAQETLTGTGLDDLEISTRHN